MCQQELKLSHGNDSVYRQTTTTAQLCLGIENDTKR